ncbi:MAG: type II toxin-antitoxin system RelE/ParE family toxin [Verrucomicrobia bacterium]|nr:type II toxin-antitoxin system RelE/ParE family toxin [Verrucomicrobiota bacterium]
MTVVILEDAAEDMEAGRRFYESRELGIGDYFVESILSDLGSLVLYAGVHRVHLGFHRMLSKRFPFGIYYEVERQTAYVYAILDMRRDPLWIRRELQKRR